MVPLECLRKKTYMVEREMKILGSCEGLRRLNTMHTTNVLLRDSKARRHVT